MTDSRNLFSATLQLLADLRPPPLGHRRAGINAWGMREHRGDDSTLTTIVKHGTLSLKISLSGGASENPFFV